MEMMTMTEQSRTTARPARPAAKRGSSTPQRILSAGLAGATCVGIVGLLGVRMVQAQEADAAATGTAAVDTTAQPATTSTGLTQADLDAYAAALSDQRARLDAYRADLVSAAEQLGLITSTGQSGQPAQPGQVRRAAQPRPDAVPLQSAPAPQAAAPQSYTKGS